MVLFENIQRYSKDPAQYCEQVFDYYQRSDREDIQRIRNILNSWFEGYPDEEKSELLSRFKKTFYDCFYELFIYTLFKSLGFEIEIHPTVPDSLKRPDFLIKKQDLEIYIEAKSVNGLSLKEEAFKRFVNQFYDYLNKVRIKGHVLHLVKLDFKTQNQPSTKKIIKHLETEANILISREAIDDEVITYDTPDIYLVVKLLPLRDKSKIYADRPIGIHPIELYYGGGEEYIRNAIIDKGKRYGRLDKPFIICINAIDGKVNGQDDIESAIWGSIAMAYQEGVEDSSKLIHLENGVFYSNKKGRLKNLSGVFVSQVFPHNIDNAYYYLCQHPLSDNKLDFSQLGLEYWNIGNDNMKNCVEGKSIGELLKKI